MFPSFESPIFFLHDVKSRKRASTVDRADHHVSKPELATASGLALRGFPLVAGVRGGGSGAVAKPKTGAAQAVKIASYFFLWYAFNGEIKSTSAVVPLRSGLVGFGSVRFGSFRFVSVRFGSVRLGLVRVRLGTVWLGYRSGSVRFGSALCKDVDA